MLYDDLTAIPIEVFGGYTPALPPSALPSGAAAIAQDCIFPQGSLRTRGGLRALNWAGAALAAGAQVNGLKSYITPSLAQRLLVWDSLGEFFKENPQGTLNLINSRPYQNLLYQSQTLFGREYQAFYNANGGFDIPRQYVDTQAPVYIAYSLQPSPTGIIPSTATVSLASISEVGTLVTAVLIAPLNPGFIINPGNAFGITGTATAYDGGWILNSISSDRLTITFTATTGGLPTLLATGNFSYTILTLQLTTPSQITLNSVIRIQNATNPIYNQSYPVNQVSASGDTLQVPSGFTFAGASGGGTISLANGPDEWDRVSQSGPGASPNVVDNNLQYNLLASPNGIIVGTATTAILTISEAGNVVTMTVLFPNFAGLPLKVGDPINITGFSGANAPYNTQGPITYISADQLTIQMQNPTSGLPTLGVAAGGTINVVRVDFLTSGTPAVQIPLGDNFIIAGATNPIYNGTYQARLSTVLGVSAVVSTAAGGNSGGGTLTLGGNIAAGTHQVSLAFITRQGFITQGSIPSTWVAAGSRQALCSNIAIGPSNVVARLLLFTPVITPPATTGTFYSIPNGSPQILNSMMLIPDNVTTTISVDFTDAILISSFNAEYLFSQVELGESGFMIGYNSRTVWLGERSKQGNFNNLGFDGGFGTDVSKTRYPLGWTQDPANYAGGTVGESEWEANSAGVPSIGLSGGASYAIIGDGATAIRGKITQTAYQDYLNVPIIQRNTGYSVRARLALAGAAAQGTVHINLQSTINGFTTVGLAVPVAQLTVAFQEFTATLTDLPLMTPPTDLLLQVYVDGTLTNGAMVLIDSIQPFVTQTPVNYSTARFSHAFNPESFDGTTGQVQVRPGDGQQFRAGFPLRNNLYLAKDHYLGYVADDGVNEPASWAFNEVSATIGICGPNAVDWNEEWAVFAERSGLYICWGSDPVKITQEIEYDAAYLGRPSWNAINWAYGHTIWVRIDRVNKMILVGAPINGATSPNIVFALDYQWLMSAEEIASSPLVTYSAFTGKSLAHGRGRRWMYWNIAANSMTFAERSDGTAQPFFGNGAGNALIYQQFDASLQASDNGVAVNMIYQTYGCPASIEEQALQLGSHRKLLGYFKFRAIGAGSLNLSISTARRTTTLRSYTLSMNPVEDSARPVNIHADRFYMIVQTNAVGSWAQIEKLIPCMKKDPSMLVSGIS
jgi:hypothetical protein